MTNKNARWLIIVVVVIGVALRFAFLDRKVYWYDEAFTSLEISGFSPREAQSDILTGRVVSRKELEKYQFPSVGSNKTLNDTLHGLVVNEPQLTPAYFVLLRWWSLLWPNSIAAIRALSAIFSALLLGASFWVFREAFPESPRAAYISTALIASSPFQLLYAQEARPYAMWGVMALTSSALLLRAMRSKGWFAWALYGLSACLGLYTYLLSILWLGGHALFVAVESRARLTSNVKRFSIVLVTAMLLFAAWPYRGQHMGTGNEHYSLARYAFKWSRSIGILFADFNIRSQSTVAILTAYSLLLAGLLLLVAYSIHFLWCKASRSQSAVLILSIGSTIFPLVALDLIKGSSQALVTRYMFPSMVAIQMAIGYTIASKTGLDMPTRTRMIWATILAGLLLTGFLSGADMVYAEQWWNKDPNNGLVEAGRIINAAEGPVVVVSDTWFIPVLSLEHKIRSDVHYQLTVEPIVPKIDASARAVFLLRPSNHLIGELSRCYRVESIYSAADLWKIESKGAEKKDEEAASNRCT